MSITLDPLTLDAYWLVLWEPTFKTLKAGQVGCVFATEEEEAWQMLAAWPGGEVVEVGRVNKKKFDNIYRAPKEACPECHDTGRDGVSSAPCPACLARNPRSSTSDRRCWWRSARPS